MAIRKNYKVQTSFGVDVTIKNAYIKASGIAGGKDDIVLTVFIFDEDITKQVDVKYYSFAPNLESDDNFIKQAYLYLKTLPEYADAIDC
jgi:hypothetical protein